VSLADAHRIYQSRLAALRRDSRPAADDPVNPFPCLRCAKASGKLSWLNAYPQSAWHSASLAAPATALSDHLYQLTPIGRPGVSIRADNPSVEVAV